jgi:hypothetical protein
LSLSLRGTTPPTELLLHADENMVRHDDVTTLEKSNYRKWLGSCGWIGRKTRFDILYALSVLSRHQNNPCRKAIDALIHLICYLALTVDLVLVFSKKRSPRLAVAADSNWNKLEEKCKSTGGFVIARFGLITAKCARQSIVARSTQEAETIELENAVTELAWIRNIYAELGTVFGPTDIYEDNQACLDAVRNYGSRMSISKHFMGRVYRIKQYVTDGLAHLVKIPSADNVADIFTKPLDQALTEKFRAKLLGHSPTFPS